MKQKTRRLATVAVLTALSVVLVALVHFPLFPAVSFLEYDPADIPILICGFAFGPAAGILVTLIAAVIQGFTVSAASGIYGIIMHLLATGANVGVASLVYKKHKTKKGAAVSILCGALTHIVIMFAANLVVTPYFMMNAVNRATVGAVLDLMPFILLFNAIKAGINGAVTFFIYKSISGLITRIGAKPGTAEKERKA